VEPSFLGVRSLGAVFGSFWHAECYDKLTGGGLVGLHGLLRHFTQLAAKGGFPSRAD
jgi:hypothetical protein